MLLYRKGVQVFFAASVAFVACLAIIHEVCAADIPGLTPTLGANAGYTLTSSGSSSSIILYEIDDQLNATAKDYTLGLAKTEYTYGTGGTTATVSTGVADITLNYSTKPDRINVRTDRSEETFSPTGPLYDMPKTQSGPGVYIGSGSGKIDTVNADFFSNSTLRWVAELLIVTMVLSNLAI